MQPTCISSSFHKHICAIFNPISGSHAMLYPRLTSLANCSYWWFMYPVISIARRYRKKSGLVHVYRALQRRFYYHWKYVQSKSLSDLLVQNGSWSNFHNVLLTKALISGVVAWNSWRTNCFNRPFQALSENLFIRADIAFIALETFCLMGYIRLLTYLLSILLEIRYNFSDKFATLLSNVWFWKWTLSLYITSTMNCRNWPTQVPCSRTYPRGQSQSPSNRSQSDNAAASNTSAHSWSGWQRWRIGDSFSSRSTSSRLLIIIIIISWQSELRQGRPVTYKHAIKQY